MATYIIRAGLAGPVKIGKADDSNQRLRELQDDETKHIVLAAAGRRDLIDPQETIRDLARQVLAKHGPDHPVLQLPDVKAVLEADERCAALGAVEGK
jgi:hypothetical protein